jgi:hypothetical protein
MKRPSLTLLALSAALLTSGYLLGQGASKNAPAAPAAAAKPMKLVKVAVLPTVQANQEFQKNVQLVQAQRQRVIELDGQVKNEKDAAKKKELQKELDTLLAKLNENNQAMTKVYGFSLTRNYSMEIEKSHIYMFVTEEEAAQIEKEQKAKEAADKSKGGKK